MTKKPSAAEELRSREEERRQPLTIEEARTIAANWRERLVNTGVLSPEEAAKRPES